MHELSHITLILLAAALLASAGVCTAQDKPAAPTPPAQNPPAPQANPSQRPAELKALDRLAGVWDVEYAARVPGATPDAPPVFQKGNSIEAMEWVLESSFLAGRSSDATGKRTLSAWMWGYDQSQKVFRLWWFGVGGQVTEWQGAYDPGEQTFTLRTQAARGHQTTATIKFLDDNTRTQSVVVRDASGKSTQQIEARMKRRK